MFTTLTHWLRPANTRAARPVRRLRCEPLEDRLAPAFTGVVATALGDLNGDGFLDLVTGQGSGGGEVRVFDGRTGQVALTLTPYPGFAGGVYVAAGDVDGDGKAEVVTGTGDGAGPHVRVFDGVTGAERRSLFPYEESFRGGVVVAAADVTGDGRAELITGTGVGGGPRVRVIDPISGDVFNEFMAYEESFRGGVLVTAGDIDGDGKAEIVTGTGKGGGPRVAVFDALSGGRRGEFMAYEESFRGGVLVTAGDIDGDGKAEIVTGAGKGGGPVVGVFRADGTPVGRFLAGDDGYREGVTVSVGDTNRDDRADVVAGSGPGAVSFHDADTHTAFASVSPFEPGAALPAAVRPVVPEPVPPVVPEPPLPAPQPPPPDTTPPRVVGAVSTSNTTVRVAFSEPMADVVLDPRNYAIAQVSFNPDAGTLRVTAVRFPGVDRGIVELTTEPQNELTYQVTVAYATDAAGNPLAAPVVSGVGRIDPTRATFQGTPPVGDELLDSDGDGLTDNDERRGWLVVVKPANGVAQERWVTSDPFTPDTDGDGFPDGVEAQLRLDPRDPDSDDDLLTDWQEYNEVFSDHLSGDTDGDGVDDGTEYLGVRSSPVHADTDGDQIPDGEEIPLGGFRNVLVADLPRAGIEVGSTDLRLDVRFTRTDSTGTTELESRSVGSSLVQSNRKEYSTSSARTLELTNSLSAGLEFVGGYENKSPVVKVTVSTKTENSVTNSWATTNTRTSAEETQRAYQESLTTSAETSENSTVQREVAGARMSAAVTLRSAGTIAYRIKNVQVTALVQSPENPAELVPVATLLPDAEPADGYSLGPLAPERGPVIVSSTTVFPARVEELMRNPRGLVFRLSNYDIVDELGRNFAFTSKDIVERTAALEFDFGAADSDGDGRSDRTESYRVATYAGRPIADTDGDGVVGPGDRRVTFDPFGRQVGITLRDALAAVGLVGYDERETPSASLTPEQRQTSYSTFRDADGFERVFRVRDVRPADTLEAALAPGARRAWEILTPTGIDRTKDLDSQILMTGEGVQLAFLVDEDDDRIPANVEFLLGTSDRNPDTDGDTLGDRVEAFVGWQVDLGGQGIRQVFSSPTLTDTDGPAESPSDPFQIEPARPRWTDADEAPARQIDEDGDGVIDRLAPDGPDDVVTDPRAADTDGDGISDAEEVFGYSVRPRGSDPEAPLPPPITTDPTDADTDGDTAADGLERRLGGNPLDPSDRNLFADDDRDGLANVEETDGWVVRVRPVSTTAFQETSRFIDLHVRTNPFDPDSDADGIPDGEEFLLRTVPSYHLADADAGRDFPLFPGDPFLTSADVTFGGLSAGEVDALLRAISPLDTDGDGLTDVRETRGFQLGGRTDRGVTLDPTDADTDNDGRSDGDEAELVDAVATRWVVALAGKAPRRVYSDPRFADADLDGLADGDEYAYRSDPGAGDTDGDGRIDGADTIDGLSPVAEDFLVTVTFTALKITQDGDRPDDNGEPTHDGDFGFAFGVRRPDRTRVNGLSADLTHVVAEQTHIDGPRSAHTDGRSDLGGRLPFSSNGGDQTFFPPHFGVQINGEGVGSTLSLAGLIPLAERSVRFAVRKDERFAIEGVVVEKDDADYTSFRRGFKAFLGGAEGVSGKAGGADLEGGLVSGRGLEAGTVTQVTFEFKPEHTYYYDDRNAALRPEYYGEGHEIAGILYASYAVS